MFSGIVEAEARVLDARKEGGLVRLDVERPHAFDDLKPGDSIATNGVCLTVENFDERKITFALGDETLKITGWSHEALKNARVNLERSLRMGDRIHGHMVSGHVDAVGEVVEKIDRDGSVEFAIRTPLTMIRYLWPKGSWAVNGVSLTINAVEDDLVRICLIPETLKRTNLGALETGSRVNLEVDLMARGLVSFLERKS